MSTPDEFKKVTNVTLGFIVWVAGVSFSMGMIYKSIIDNDKEHITITNYVEQEVSGLRSDWERDRIEQNKRLEKLEK